MRNYLDIIGRGHSGEWMAEEDWDLEKVALTTRRLVREHGLAWEKDHIITDDPSLADAVFRAGFELAATAGVYQRSTDRVIRFSEEELADGLQAMPQSLVVGEGEDARTLYSRGICDERLPLIWGGPPGTPFPEHLFLANTVSYAQEPIIDLLTCGSLTVIQWWTRSPRTRLTVSAYATKASAVARAGQPP